MGSDDGEVLASSEFDIPVSEQYPEAEVEGLEGENPQVSNESSDESAEEELDSEEEEDGDE